MPGVQGEDTGGRSVLDTEERTNITSVFERIVKNPFEPTEDDEQILVVDYLEAKGIKFTHIPNSTFTKSWQVKLKNKRMGVRPGFPDLVMIINNQFVAMEMKRKKGGVLSNYQKEWIEALRRCGLRIFVCHGFDEAKQVIDSLI